MYIFFENLERANVAWNGRTFATLWFLSPEKNDFTLWSFAPEKTDLQLAQYIL